MSKLDPLADGAPKICRLFYRAFSASSKRQPAVRLREHAESTDHPCVGNTDTCDRFWSPRRPRLGQVRSSVERAGCRTEEGGGLLCLESPTHVKMHRQGFPLETFLAEEKQYSSIISR